MEEQFENFAANLTEFLLFFVVAAILTIIFVVVYTRITKHDISSPGVFRQFDRLRASCSLDHDQFQYGG